MNTQDQANALGHEAHAKGEPRNAILDAGFWALANKGDTKPADLVAAWEAGYDESRARFA